MSTTPIWSFFPRLETERLVLREIAPSDAEDLYRIFSDEETMRYWSCRPYESVDQAHRYIESMAEAVREEACINWAITLRDEDSLIGKCAYVEWRKPHRRAEVGY